MNSLDQEISAAWDDFRRAPLDDYEKVLKKDIPCSPCSLKRHTERVKAVETELRRYMRMPQIGLNRKEASILSRLENLLDQAGESIGDAIMSSLEDLEASYGKAMRQEPCSESLNNLAREASCIEEASRLCGSEYRRASSLSRKISESIKGFTHGCENRFGFNRFSKKYDLEYSSLRASFDMVDCSKRKSLRKLKQMALRSQHLAQKYKSIGDEDGYSKASMLHQEVSEAAERIVPIYQSWKRRNITLSVVLIAGAMGFWKGSYLSHLVFRQAGGNTSLVMAKGDTDYKERIRELELMVDSLRREEVSQGIIDLPGTRPAVQPRAGLKEKPAILPDEVIESVARHPETKYALYLEVPGEEGILYDVENFEVKHRFEYLADRAKTPEGSFPIGSHGAGEDSPFNKGSAYFQLGSTGLTFSGTYSKDKVVMMNKKWYETDGSIYVPDHSIVQIYKAISQDIERTIIVIGS